MTTDILPNYLTTFATGGTLVRALTGCRMNSDELNFHGLDMDELPFDSLDAPEWIPAGSCIAPKHPSGRYTMSVCNPRN